MKGYAPKAYERISGYKINYGARLMLSHIYAYLYFLGNNKIDQFIDNSKYLVQYAREK